MATTLTGPCHEPAETRPASTVAAEYSTFSFCSSMSLQPPSEQAKGTSANAMLQVRARAFMAWGVGS